MAVSQLDRAIEELEDISNRRQISCWFSGELGIFETRGRAILSSLGKKESENWLELGEDVEPAAMPDEGYLLKIEFEGPVVQGTAGVPDQGITVKCYDLSNMARPTMGSLGSNIALATYYQPYPYLPTSGFIVQPSGLVLGTERRPKQVRLLSDEWNLCGNLITIYSKEQTLETTKLLTITTELSRMQVSSEVDKGVLSLLNETTMQAVSIINDILVNEVSQGLPVKHISIEPLIDRDAGQWSEVVFTIQVDLDSHHANHAWDNILNKVSEVADRQTNREVTTALLEKIGIHFTWVTPNNV